MNRILQAANDEGFEGQNPPEHRARARLAGGDHGGDQRDGESQAAEDWQQEAIRAAEALVAANPGLRVTLEDGTETSAAEALRQADAEIERAGQHATAIRRAFGLGNEEEDHAL